MVRLYQNKGYPSRCLHKHQNEFKINVGVELMKLLSDVT